MCSVHGCPNLTPCPTHPPRQRWDRSTRGQSLPVDWRKLRGVVLARDRGVCQLRLPGCTVRASHVDHIRPHAFGGSDDIENLAAACPNCHDEKTKTEARLGRERAAALRRGEHWTYPGDHR